MSTFELFASYTPDDVDIQQLLYYYPTQNNFVFFKVDYPTVMQSTRTSWKEWLTVSAFFIGFVAASFFLYGPPRDMMMNARAVNAVADTLGAQWQTVEYGDLVTLDDTLVYIVLGSDFAIGGIPRLSVQSRPGSVLLGVNRNKLWVTHLKKHNPVLVRKRDARYKALREKFDS